MDKNVIRITESELKRIVNESVNRILNERRDKITPKTFNIDGVDYESTNQIKGGGAWHPGFRFKDHESHNPNKLKSYRKRKDGYRYAQSYAGRPDDLHKHLTSEGKINEDDFKPNGYKATSAFGGYEIQLDDRGEMARLRDSHTGNVSEWLEIQFDENGVAYVIDENGDKERLCDYMRY